MQKVIRLTTFIIMTTFLLVGCNVATQEELSTEAQSALDGVSVNTFQYNISDLDIVVNTTNVSIYPVGTFSGTRFTVNPSLPDGLVIIRSTGEIKGTPIETSSAIEYTVTAVGSDFIKTATFTLAVNEEPPSSINYTNTVLEFDLGTTTSFTPTVTGGDVDDYSIYYDFDSDGDHDAADDVIFANLDLNFDTTTGVISSTGAPTETSFTGLVTISANNTAGSADRVLTIIVPDDVLTSLTYPSNDGQTIDIAAGTSFTTMTPTVVGTYITPVNDTSDATDIKFTISPSLPSGLALNDEGEVYQTGTISYSSTSSYTITATNDTSSTSATITINFTYPPKSLTYATYDLATADCAGETTNLNCSDDNAGVEFQLNVAIPNIKATYEGGTPVTSYACTNNCIPGISVNSTTGLISGTPTALGLYNTEITVTNSDGTTTASMNFYVVGDYPEGASGEELGYSATYNLEKDSTVVSTYMRPKNLNGIADSYGLSLATTLDSGTVYDIDNIPGLKFDTSSGEFSGTPTSVTSQTFTITGYNNDHTATANKQTTQSVTINVTEAAPILLSYGDGTTESIFNSSNNAYEFRDGIANTIEPCHQTSPRASNCVGGIPTSYSISPSLPDGLTIDGITGVIGGTPTESTSLRYYTVTATNTGGTYTETLAISTNTLVEPLTLNYNDSSADCSGTIGGMSGAINQIDLDIGEDISVQTAPAGEPCYVGSQGVYSVTPSLPDGLTINRNTGIITGIPLISNNNDNSDVYAVKIVNSKGTLTTNLILNVGDIAPPSNLVYENPWDTTTPFTFTAGEDLSVIEHSVDYDSNPSAGGYVTYYTIPAVTNADDAGNIFADNGDNTWVFGSMVYDLATGDFSGAAQATNPGELDPSGMSLTLQANNDQGGTTNTINLIVNEAPVDITYEDEGYGDNVIFFEGGQAKTATPTHNGGDVATTSSGVASTLNDFGGFCFPSSTLVSDSEGEGYRIGEDGTNAASTGFSFLGANCSIVYDGSTCFTDDSDGDGKAGSTIIYNIIAQNSGNQSGVESQLKVHFYDKPDFTIPSGSGFTDQLVLLNGNLASDTFTPTTGTCHSGSFELLDSNNSSTSLPSPLTFNTSTGEIETNQQILFARTNYNMRATESSSGFNFTDTDSFSLQVNFEEDNDGESAHEYETFKFDLNADGAKDVIVRSKLCDDESCSDSSLSYFLQNTIDQSILYSSGSILPGLATSGARHAAGIKYDTNKAGLIYLKNVTTTGASGNSLYTQSTTAVESYSQNYTAYDSDSDPQAIVPFSVEDSTSSGFGLFARDTANNSLDIYQFDINNNDLSDITDNATAKVEFQDSLGGGADINSLQMIAQVDIGNGTNNNAFVAYGVTHSYDFVIHNEETPGQALVYDSVNGAYLFDTTVEPMALADPSANYKFSSGTNVTGMKYFENDLGNAFAVFAHGTNTLTVLNLGTPASLSTAATSVTVASAGCGSTINDVVFTADYETIYLVCGSNGVAVGTWDNDAFSYAGDTNSINVSGQAQHLVLTNDEARAYIAWSDYGIVVAAADLSTSFAVSRSSTATAVKVAVDTTESNLYVAFEGAFEGVTKFPINTTPPTNATHFDTGATTEYTAANIGFMQLLDNSNLLISYGASTQALKVLETASLSDVDNPAALSTSGSIDSIAIDTTNNKLLIANSTNSFIRMDSSDITDITEDTTALYKDAESKICIIPYNGTTFQDTCITSLDVLNDGTVVDIKMANVLGDSLDDLYVHINDGENKVLIYENLYNTTPGLFNLTETLTLGDDSNDVRIDLADINFDGNVDIVANDLNDSATPGTIDGMTIYYNTGLGVQLYSDSDVYTDKLENTLYYSGYEGSTHETELLQTYDGSTYLFFNCQTDTANSKSSCGIATAASN